MTFGFTDGTSTGGLTGGSNGLLSVQGPNYSDPVGTSYKRGSVALSKTVSITTDPTKSGLIATFSGLTLGTVPSEKLGNFYIRY